MNQPPGKTSPKIVRKQLSGFDKFRKYAAEPCCLGCGYTLRGLDHSAGLACPECGNPCDLESLAQQIGGLKISNNPIGRELNVGLGVLAFAPISALVTLPIGLLLGKVIQAMLRSISTSVWVVISPMLLGGLVLFFAWLFSIWLAYRAMGGWRGPVLWAWFHVLLAVSMMCLVMPLAWIVLLVLATSNNRTSSAGGSGLDMHRDFALRFDEWPVHVGALLSCGFLWLLWRCHNRIVVPLIRQRSIRLARFWLGRSEVFGSGGGEGEPLKK